MGSYMRLIAATAILAASTAMPSYAQDLSGKRVVFSEAVSGLDVFEDFARAMKRVSELPGHGQQFAVVSAEGNPLKQITDIEGLISQGVDAIVFIALSSAGWDDVLARAQESGVIVVNHSGYPLTGATQNVLLPFYDTGYQVGKAAADWLNEKYGGHGKVALLGQFGDAAQAARTSGMKAGIEQNSSAEIVVEIDSVDRPGGATAAANAIAAHPDLRVILAFNDDNALGALQAAREAGYTDPNKLLIAGNDGLPDALTAIEAGTPFQISLGIMIDYAGVQAMRDIEAMLQGQKKPPTRVLSGRLITRDTVDEYRSLQADPLAPEVQHVYDEAMYYSQKALSTGDAPPKRGE